MDVEELHDKRRSDLVRLATEAAARRLDDAGADSAAAFAAIAELIMWVVAADDGLQRHPNGGAAYNAWRAESRDRRQLLRGLRYIRNMVIHESRAWEQDFKGVYTERYYRHYGAWVWADLPSPALRRDQDSGWQRARPDHRQEQYEAYKERVRGRAVLDTALDALNELRKWWGEASTS